MSITMVMGASVGAKLLMVCGTPSSVMRKFSRFKPVKMSPFFVVATTSMVTTGTSTEIDVPDCAGGACGGLAGVCCGACCAGLGGGGAPPCGPSGACASAICAAKGRASTHAAIIITLESRVFMPQYPLLE
jgi:hypothetical protein